MTQFEFVQELEQELRGQVSPQTVEYNVNYYREYIREQLASGKTQEEVMATLGSPRMIAKTIISAEEAKKEEEKGQYTRNGRKGEDGGFHFNLNTILYGKWYYKVIAIAVTLFVLYLVFSLIFTAVKILFWPAVILIICYALWDYLKKRG